MTIVVRHSLYTQEPPCVLSTASGSKGQRMTGSQRPTETQKRFLAPPDDTHMAMPPHGLRLTPPLLL